MVIREPIAPLRPFLKQVWAADERRSPERFSSGRERLLPSGTMHLVFRLSEDPIRIFDSVDDWRGHCFHRGVIGGLRAGFYVKEIAPSARTVGAMLQPGVSELLFGIPADELAERHTALEDLWGSEARALWQRMGEEPRLESQLGMFEQFLLRRLPRVHGIHPAIAHALGRFAATTDIGQIVEETGYSHRRFIELFRRNIGLAPRVYTRLLRHRRAFRLIAVPERPSWIDVAMEAGYADQAHFIREFREFTGITPTEYVAGNTRHDLHVPMRR